MGGATQHLDGVLPRHDEQDQLQGRSICLRREDMGFTLGRLGWDLEGVQSLHSIGTRGIKI